MGCQYEPDGEFFKEVDANRVSQPSIRLENTHGVISLNKRTGFSYNIVTPPSHFRTEVFFDGEMIDYTEGDYADGYFNLDPRDYEEGQYVLTIVTTVGSGTGSLADKIGAEHIQSERTWEVIIERPKPVKIKNVFIDSGSIRLEWEAYQSLKQEKFLRYEIVYGGRPDKVLATVEDQNVTFFYDSTFFSGYRNYRVNIRTEHHTAYGEVFLYSYPHPPYEPNLQADLSDDSLKMRWEQPILYNNVKQFEVSFCCGKTGMISTRVNNTSFAAAVSPSFGYATPASLRARKGYNDHFRFYEHEYYSTELFVGDSVDVGYNLRFGPTTQSYYGIYESNRYHYRFLSKRYDAKIAEQTQYPSLEFWHYTNQYAMSYNGATIYEYDAYNNEITEIDPATLKELQTYDANELFKSSDATTVRNVSIADDHTMALTHQEQSFVFDMKSATLLKEFATPEKLLLSPDGEFLLAADTLYRRSGSDYVSVSVLDSVGLANTDFNSIHPNKLIITQSSTIKVYDCQILSYVSNVELADNIDFFSIDAHTNTVGGYRLQGDKYYVVNLEDGSIKTIDIFPNRYYDYHQNYFLLNGNLFSKEGFYLKLTK